jgi:hypothetical protein
VRKTPTVGPEVGPTSAFYSCIPTGMHGPTYIFWANLTLCSLKLGSLFSLLGFPIALGVGLVLKVSRGW